MKTSKIITEYNVEYLVVQDGPIIIYKHRDTGLWHRENDLPAYINYSYSTIIKAFYENGKLHRIKGPANILTQKIEWWYQGKPVKVKNQQEYEQWLKLRVFE